MQTITISIQGSVTVSETVQVSDEAALPLFIRLKEALGSDGSPKPRGRRRKVAAGGNPGDPSAGQENENRDPEGE
jgi:hypothetical protein